METISRSHTFWKSDETNNLTVAHSQETGGDYFLPGGLLNTNLPGASGASKFDLHSLFAGPFGASPANWTTLDAAGRERVAAGDSRLQTCAAWNRTLSAVCADHRHVAMGWLGVLWTPMPAKAS